MPLKRIVLIIMCALLLLTVIMAAVVIGRVAPTFQALLGGGKPATKPTTTVTTPTTTVTAPTRPTTQATQPTTQPTQPTQPTTQPTQPTTVPPVSGHQHEFELTSVEAPTCEIPGYSVYTCACGEVEMRDPVAAIGHSYGLGQKVVSCTEEGYTEYTCMNCGEKDRQNITDPLGHDNYLVERQEHSCTQDGYELYRCRRCNEETKENEIIATGHTDFTWIQLMPPGVDEPGEEFRRCTTCMEEETRPCQLKVTSKQELQGQEEMKGYIIFVGTETSPKALRYIVNDYSFSPDLFVSYSEEGLLISYTDKSGKSQTTTLAPLQEVELTIDSEGKIVEDLPDTDPETPSETTPPNTEPETTPDTDPETDPDTDPETTPEKQPEE